MIHWLSASVMPLLQILFYIALDISVFILLPLAIFRKTRGVSATGLYMVSYVFGINLWLWSFLLVYQIWGTVALVIGLLFFGVGVVPIAFFAILFGHMQYITQMIGLLICTFGARYLGMYWINKSEEKQDESMVQPYPYLPQDEQEELL